MAWQLYLLYGLGMGGQYAYHRWVKKDLNPKPPPPEDFKGPTAGDGAPVSLLYGRCLVNRPVCAWIGGLQAVLIGGESGDTAFYQYRAQMMMCIGVPFRNGTQRLHAVYLGGTRLHGKDEWDSVSGGGAMSTMTGDGNYEAGHSTGSAGIRAGVDPDSNTSHVGGYVEFLNGKTTQLLIDPDTLEPLTLAGELMTDPEHPPVVSDPALVDASLVPGYRGVLSAFLFGRSQTPGPSLAVANTGWRFSGASMDALGFEVSTYPIGFSTYPTQIGDECNPVHVIIDLLTGGLGKLGIPTSIIDAISFGVAGQALADEMHGYSRCVDERRSVHDVINEILEQIDAVLYEDPRDGLIKIKLIRPDYDLNAALVVHPGNCDAVEGYAMSEGGTNAVNVQFTDRANHYINGATSAMDNASIVASGTTPVNVELRYPGCCTPELARVLAARELAARSQPLARCSVIVDRSFRNVMPGDVVRLSWPEYHLNEKVFRVGQVDRGTLTDGRIRLDLVQDFFFVHRRHVQPGGPVTPFPTPDLPVLAG